jgi:hypothetical protein
MAIRVPAEMVYYLERDADAQRLLCWIPPQQYEDVAVDDQALQRLQRDYPRGVEVRVDARELEAEGIRLPVPPHDLMETYRGLRDREVLHESGMIIARTLERTAEAAIRGERLDSVIEADQRQPRSFPAPAPGEPLRQVRRLADAPEMVGDEEARTVFQRLTVRQRGT